MAVSIAIAVVAVILVLWIITPAQDREHRLTPRQQRKWDRLAELDAARIVLIEELGIEPTAAELWNVSPPHESEGE